MQNAQHQIFNEICEHLTKAKQSAGGAGDPFLEYLIAMALRQAELAVTSRLLAQLKSVPL